MADVPAGRLIDVTIENIKLGQELRKIFSRPGTIDEAKGNTNMVIGGEHRSGTATAGTAERRNRRGLNQLLAMAGKSGDSL